MNADEWLEANDATLKRISRSTGRGDEDALQEARIAIMQAFRDGTWDADKGPLDPYMRSVAIRAITGYFRGDAPTGAEKLQGSHGDMMDKGRAYSIEALTEAGRSDGGGNDPYEVGEQELGYDSVEVDELAKTLRAEMANGLTLKEAALKHGLQAPPSPRVRGVSWQKHCGPGRAGRWVVGIKLNGKRHFGGYFRSQREAEARALELRKELGAGPQRARRAA